MFIYPSCDLRRALLSVSLVFFSHAPTPTTFFFAYLCDLSPNTHTHPPPPKNTTRKPKALDTYADLDRTIGVDGYTLTAIIDVLRRLGDWRRALPLLDRLAGLGVPANQGLRTSVNAVLSAMGPDNYRRAKELVEKAAVDWAVDGDIVTYGTLLLLASARLPPPAPLSSGAPVVLPSAAAVAFEPRARSSPRAGREAKGRLLEEGEAAAAAAAERRENGKWETVNVFWRAVEGKAVPSEACLDMVVFALARNGLWEEASAFVQAIEEAGLKVSRHQVGVFLPGRRAMGLPWRPVESIGVLFVFLPRWEWSGLELCSCFVWWR